MFDPIMPYLTPDALAGVLIFVLISAVILSNPAVTPAQASGMFALFTIGYAVLVTTLANLRFLALLADAPGWPLSPIVMLIAHAAAYAVVMGPLVWMLRRGWRWWRAVRTAMLHTK